MTRDRRGFSYALETVRSLTDWELNDLVRDLADLNKTTDQQQARVRELSGQFEAVRSAVIAQRQQDGALDIDGQRRAHAYLLQVQQRLIIAQQQLQELETQREALMQKLNGVRKFADSLDKNKAVAAAEHDKKIANQEMILADDNWLQRLHGRSTR